MHQDDYKIQYYMQDPLSYLASSEPDTMYFDQAMKHPDRKEFLNASIIQVNSPCQLKHWRLLPHKEVPKGQPIPSFFWSMNRK